MVHGLKLHKFNITMMRPALIQLLLLGRSVCQLKELHVFLTCYVMNAFLFVWYIYFSLCSSRSEVSHAANGIACISHMLCNECILVCLIHLFQSLFQQKRGLPCWVNRNQMEIPWATSRMRRSMQIKRIGSRTTLIPSMMDHLRIS